MHATIRVATVLVVSAAVLAACSGGDDDTDVSDRTEVTSDTSDENGDLPDPCDLVTQHDAERLFGEGVEAERVDGANAGEVVGQACDWENTDSDEEGEPSHLLLVRVVEGERFFNQDVFESAMPIDDLGDEAFVASGGGLRAVDVQFVKDDIVFFVNYLIINIGVEGATVEATAKTDDVVTLARRAESRM